MRKKTTTRIQKAMACLLMLLMITSVLPVGMVRAEGDFDFATLGDGLKPEGNDARPDADGDPGTGSALRATGRDLGPFSNVTNKITLDPGSDQLCKRPMTGELEFTWPESSTYLDVVVIQDFSASYKGEIARVGKTLQRIIDSLNMSESEMEAPKDRFMVVGFKDAQSFMQIQADGSLYNEAIENPQYSIFDSGLAVTASSIKNWINTNYTPEKCFGATPTPDGMAGAYDRYHLYTQYGEYNKPVYYENSQKKQRKTIYILITDGAANSSTFNNLGTAGQEALKLKPGLTINVHDRDISIM